MEKVTVSADALRQVLQALVGPAHYIRELQAIRSLGGSPIDQLMKDYNERDKFVVVPRDPSEELLAAMCVAHQEGEDQFHDFIGPMGMAYRAMLAACDA